MINEPLSSSQFMLLVKVKGVSCMHLQSNLIITMFHQSNKLGLVLPLIYIYLTLLDPVVAKGQYVVPLNMGMKVSIPYDIANLFGRFPIQGALSVVLALALNAILFFGVITAPFGYFFGIPSKKYVLGDVEVSETSSAAASKRMDFVDEGVECK